MDNNEIIKKEVFFVKEFTGPFKHENSLNSQ